MSAPGHRRVAAFWMGRTVRQRYDNVYLWNKQSLLIWALRNTPWTLAILFDSHQPSSLILRRMNPSAPSQHTTDTPTKIIVLVGLMGAGKSCVGRRLAQRLNVPFVDADAEVEEAAGCSIADIFEEYGEAAFRDGERRVIARLLDGPVSVIATGGGAFIDDQTRALILSKSTSVWLRADLDTLVDRTSGRSHRPLLNAGQPREILADLIDQRYPIYAAADIVVDTGSDSVNATCARVVEAIENRTQTSATTAS